MSTQHAPFISLRRVGESNDYGNKQPKKGLNTPSWDRAELTVSTSGESRLGASSGRRAIAVGQVSTQRHDGTTEANRIICNCVTCGRVRSIESGRGGECADCWTEEVAQ